MMNERNKKTRFQAVACLLIVVSSQISADDILISGPDFEVPASIVSAELDFLPTAEAERYRSNELRLRQLIDEFYRREAVIAASINEETLKEPEFAYRLERARAEALLGIALAKKRRQIQEALPDMEQRARELYASEPARFMTKPEVRVRHILLSASTPEEKEQRMPEALSVIEKLNAGEDFSALAAEISEDTGSAERGGDLGFQKADRLVPPFSEAAFALTTPNQLSDVVETQFGLHIIQLVERKDVRQQQFDEVRDALIAQLTEEYVSEQLKNWYEDVTDPEKMTAHEDAIKRFVEQTIQPDGQNSPN